MFFFERANGRSRVGLISLIGLILVPVIIAGGFLFATWGSTDRMARVHAAVVNNDEPITINGQMVPLGRQLAGGLVDSEEDFNFTWVLTDEEDATAGLESGTYAAVVTIPTTFSARATSFSKNKADEAEPATLDVETSQVSGIADPVIGQAISAAAANALNTQLTEQYLDGIYLGFNETGKQFGKVADGADKLADGTEGLAEGISGASIGTTKLATGLDKLADGTGSLSTGAAAIGNGVGQLADGLDDAADGVSALPAGTRKLADGAAASATGAGQLSKGLSQTADGAEQLAGGISQSSTGASRLANGVGQSATGAGKLADGAAKLATGLDQFATASAKAAPQTKTLTDNLVALDSGLGAAADGAAGLSQLATGAEAQLAAFSAMSPQALGTALEPFGAACPTEIAQAGLCDIYYGGVKAGTGIGAAALTVPPVDPAGKPILGPAGDPVPGLVSGLEQFAKGLDRQAPRGELAKGAKSLAAGVKQQNDALKQFSTGATGLSDGTTALADGLDQAATGARGLSDGLGKLSTGASGLSTGLGQLDTATAGLADGLGQLATGADKLADGMPALSKGIRGASDGAATLDENMDSFVSGVGELAAGARQSAEGAGALSDGMVKLSDGGDKLGTGARELADGLADGAEAIPAYSESDREQLAKVVTNPVDSPAPDTIFSDLANTTYLSIVALWAGALASFLVLRPITSRVMSSMKPSWQLSLEALAPAAIVGAIHAVMITVVLQRLLDLSLGATASLFGLSLVTAMAFAAINHALAAWLGGVGRFISLTVLVLAAAGSILSATPAGLDAIRPYLPLTPALEGVRAIASGGEGASGATLLVIAWLLVGVVAAILAVARQRVVAPALVPATAGVSAT